MGVSPIAVPQSLAYVLNSAGAKSNVDFDYLLQTAVRESSLNPQAKASTSSAVGLFQFLESTWLQVMKEQGPRLGYQQYADSISRGADGDYTVRNKGMRDKILALREDPQIAADMAAAFTQSNGAYLESRFGRRPSPGELYIAHFLGPQGAERLFRAGLEDADQIAAKLFPRQAKANRALFYAQGEPRTIRELYRALVSKHGGATTATIDDSRFTTQQLAAANAPRWPNEPLPSRFTRDDMSFTSFFSTEAPGGAGAQPLLATSALQSLVAPAVVDPLVSAYMPTPPPMLATAPPPETGFRPLPAPAPLVPPGAALAVEPAPQADSATPRPRILMTGHPGSSAFLTQLISEP
jgi:hypothetical protein